MVTGDQELQWAYLLCPTFELSNSEGKPLTNGYIELYIAGTRDKYYAASDFNGTLHPFQIPLDSLGANIVLVNPGQAYDVYVYNRFGNLIMSRYNVTAVGAGGGSGNSNFTIDSSDGTVVVTESTDPETGVKTYDLSVPSVSGDASYWMGRGAATMGVNIEDTEYHDIQISSNSIRNEGEDIDVLDGKFSLKEGVYFWSVTVQLDKFESFDNTRQKVYVESKYNRGVYTMDMTHDESETVTFSGITVADHDGDTEGFKIKSEGTSPIRATLYHVAIHKLNPKVLGEGAHGKTYTGGDFIEITEDDVINVTGVSSTEDVERMITEAVTSIVSGEGMYTAGDYISIVNREISVTGLQPEGNYLTPEDLEGYATETYVDNSVSSFVTESTVTSLIQEAIDNIPEYEAGQYVSIVDNTISVTGLQPEGDYATNADVHEATVTAIEAATAVIPDTEEVQFEELDITQFAQVSAITGLASRTEVYEATVTAIQSATGEIPDVSDFTTHAEVYDTAVTAIQLVTGLIPDVSDFTTNSDVYEATVTAVQVATGAIPDTEEVQFEELDITQFAQVSAITGLASRTEVYESTVTAIQAATGEIPDVSDFTTNSEVYEATVTAIEYVTGLIPEAQVQSDWTEEDTESPAYIQNKPEESLLVAGDGINITESDNTIVISANVTSIDGYATESYVTAYVDNSVSSFVTEEQVTAMLPDTEEVQFEELDITQFAQATAIPVVTGFATRTEVYEAIVTGVQAATSEIPDVSDFATHAEVNESAVTSIQLVTGLIPDVSDFTTHTEVYESTVTAIEAATAVIPDTEEVQFEEINLSDYALATAIPVVTGYATHTEVHDATVTAIESVTAMIPEAQVQSDWTEDDTESPAYIQNKPEESLLVAGNGIEITESNNTIVISANVTSIDGYAKIEDVYDATVTAVQTATGLIPDVSDFTTHSEVHEATVTAIQTATGAIPDVSDFATHAEVYDTAVTAIQLVTGMIPDDYTTHSEVHEATVTAIEAATAAIPDTEDVDFEELDVTQFAMASAIPDVSNKKDKQTAVHLTQGDTWTVTSVNQNANGEIEVEWAPIPLDGFINEEQLIEAVSGVTGIGDYGQFYSTDITGAATMSKAKGTIDVTNDGKIKLKQCQSYHVTVRGRYVQGTAANTYTAVSYIEYVTNNSINFNVDKTKTESQYFELSYDLYKLNSDTNYYIFFTGVDGLIKDLFIEIHAIGSVGVGQGGSGGAEYDAGWGIRILNNVISVNPDIIATVTGVEALIQNVTATIPEAQVQSDWTENDSDDPSYIQNKPAEKQLLAGANVTITSTATSVIISADGSGDVTEAMLYDATVTAVQTATGLIPEVPDVKDVVAGENITITENATAIVISSTGGGGSDVTEAEVYDATVTAVQAATGAIPDVSDMATKTWVGNQGYLTSIPSTYATDSEVYNATVTAVQVATGLIPDVSDFMTEEQVTALIPDVPDVKDVVAGEGITITENATGIVISSTGGSGSGVTEAQVYDATVTAVQTATGLIPDTSDMATKTWVGNQGYLTSIPSSYATDTEVYEATVTAVQMATGAIPAQVQSDWAVTAVDDPAYIDNKPEIVEMEILTVSAGNGISIETNATGVIISSTGGSGSGVTEAEVYDATVTAVQAATGAIPAQVQSDWSVTATNNPAYIQNKPEVVEMEILPVSAGNGISIETSATGIVISCSVTGGSGATYTAGNMIDITNDEISVETTAGITDIQVVNALPASPVSSVLYLIPEA